MFKQLCQLYSLSLFSECGLGIGLFVREKKKKYQEKFSNPSFIATQTPCFPLLNGKIRDREK